MQLVSLAWKSLANRKGSAWLTFLSLLLSMCLLLVIEQIRTEAKHSFSRSVSGVDLIVGPKTGQLNLLLYSVFHIGEVAGSLDWHTYEWVADNKLVKWVVPIALGDSHKGFRAVGTEQAYFQHYRYANKKSLQFVKGHAFNSDDQVVLGAQVAETLSYEVGDELYLSHGTGKISFTQHTHMPFKVAGILAKTGTPVDQNLYVSLQGLERAHEQPHKPHEGHARDEEHDRSDEHEHDHHQEHGHSDEHEHDHHQEHDHSDEHGHDHHQEHDHSDEHGHEHHQEHDHSDGHEHAHHKGQVSALLVGLATPVAAFQMQGAISKYAEQPIMAILPGVALSQLWSLLAVFENTLSVIAWAVLIAALLGLATMLLATMRERRNELALLRVIGAGPITLFVLIQVEAMLLSAAACLVALLTVYAGLQWAEDWLSAEYGLFISHQLWTIANLRLVYIFLLATFCIACIPAIQAFRQSRALHNIK